MKHKQFLKDSRGASVVEFALLVAPFLLLVFGVIEVSRAFWTRQALHDIAAATARCVGVGQDECSIDGEYSESKAHAFALALARNRVVGLEDDAVTIARGVDCDGLSGTVSAKLKGAFDSVFPFEGILNFDVKACFLDWSAL